MEKMFLEKCKYNKGFTLVELLVVVAIFGLLSSIVLVSLTATQIEARDTRRMEDLRQLEIALDLHHNSNGSYTQPENISGDCSTGADTWPNCGTGDDWDVNSDLRDLVTEGFIPDLPVDPTNNATYRYTYEVWNAGQGGYSRAGQAYDLCATLEEGGTFCINKR